MKNILFICTHNSARSQMAEGLVNTYYRDNWKAYSAGTIKTEVKTLAIQAMADIGIDITYQFSKNIEYFKDTNFDVVITVCDDAKETCPFFPTTGRLLHVGFKDPSDNHGNDKLLAFIHTREEIKLWLDNNLLDF